MNRAYIQQSASYRYMKRLAQWMDTYYLDPIIGLIPGFGDLATSLLSFPLLYISAIQIRSVPLTLAVLFNTLWDILLGMLPFGIGAVLDFVNRSFIQNCRMITLYVENDRETVAAVRRKAAWMVLGIVILIALIVLAAWLIGVLMKWFWNLF